LTFRPKFREPLYINHSKDKRGCTSNSTCKKVVSKSTCSVSIVTGTDDNSTSIVHSRKNGPLCKTSAISVDAPITTTQSTTTTTVTTNYLRHVVGALQRTTPDLMN
ncbi:hypothetical protein OESDEN_12168, partial [Oesophagostomum dentatum]